LSVIEQIWSWFLEEAVYVPGLLDGLPSIQDIEHQWYWSPLPNLDEVDSATAAAKRVATGQSTLSKEHANRGTDFDTEVTRAAKDFGVDETTYRTVLFAAIFDRQSEVPLVNTTMSDESVLDDIEDAPDATLTPQEVPEVAI
jgi:hypothetical protein